MLSPSLTFYMEPSSAIRFGSGGNLMGFIRSTLINTINRHLDEWCGVRWCSVSWVFYSVDPPKQLPIKAMVNYMTLKGM